MNLFENSGSTSESSELWLNQYLRGLTPTFREWVMDALVFNPAFDRFPEYQPPLFPMNPNFLVKRLQFASRYFKPVPHALQRKNKNANAA